MTQDKKFQRKIEDFKCERCGYQVDGNGYTNHCPNCIWSKHVDVNPGDRAAECGGLMKPVELVNKSNIFYIVHKCEICGHVKKNKAEKGDNFEELIKLSSLENSKK